MKEKTPKTPRQLGEEARSLYSIHEELANGLAEDSENILYNTGQAQMLDAVLRARESGRKHDYDKRGVRETEDAIIKKRDHALNQVGRTILIQGEAKEAADKNTRAASRHYKQNAAGYHDLAVLEAAMDKVQIQVQASPTNEVHIDVTVK